MKVLKGFFSQNPTTEVGKRKVTEAITFLSRYNPDAAGLFKDLYPTV